MKIGLQVVSAIAAIFAAFFWWRASVCYVPAKRRDDNYTGISMDGSVTFLVGTTPAKLFETLQLQSKLNAYGAKCAALAAVTQAALLFI